MSNFAKKSLLVFSAAAFLLPSIAMAQVENGQITLVLKKEEPKVTTITTVVTSTQTPVLKPLPKSTSAVVKVSRLDQLIAKLKPGAKNKEVLELQTELKKLGYFPKTFKPTNKYGAQTTAAIKKYQADKKKKAAIAAKKPVATKPVVTTKPATSTKPVAVAPANPSYTMAEVQAASTASKCWSAINGKVYNLTSFFGNHPGGDGSITALCGKDGTVAFNNMHGGKVKPETVLKGLQIGLLK